MLRARKRGFRAGRPGQVQAITRHAGAVVALGASAGGVEALSCVLGSLPEDLGACVLVVLHMPATPPSRLARILARKSALPVEEARDRQPLEENRVFVAPPDRHMLVEDGHLKVVRGPHENGHRPAIDPMLRSAATAFHERTIAVILTGSLDDGAAGTIAVTRAGGRVLVQDPAEAAFPSMPLSVIAADSPCAVLPLAEIADAVVEALRGPPPPAATPPGSRQEEAEPGELVLSCPACGGVLQELVSSGVELPHFRCRIGHRFGTGSLLAARSRTVDGALGAALRALEERADLARRMSRRFDASGFADHAAKHETVAAESEQDAATIRNVLLNRGADRV
jgi:two-component system chemotaxis response regulator CheB